MMKKQQHWLSTGLIFFCLVLGAALLVGQVSGNDPHQTYLPYLRNGAAISEYPIMFVTQPPIVADFTTIGSTFGNHRSSMQSVARGGDLWIRYPDGTLKNLTAAAGYGSTAADGFQGEDAIAVRDPSIHWNGDKALFSMVVGAPTRQYDYTEFYWQLYEISGLGMNDTPVITKVPYQPDAFNNISPIYGTDNRIIFTTDRPHNGARHLYPQLDEYEMAPTVSGLWRLDPTDGTLDLLNHAPSGNFTPIIDSVGRIVFTQWDHLQRDQLADADASYNTGQNCDAGTNYGTFNYADESASAAVLADRSEVFPEPRPCRQDLLAGTGLYGHRFNHFFPWTINQDGTEGEILNHLGRHELHDYIPAAQSDDPNVIEYYGQLDRFNGNSILNMFQIKEDPTKPGSYYGVDAPEFGTHAAGQIINITAAPADHADHLAVTYITPRDTFTGDDTPHNSGRYREPLPLSDGTLIAVHTSALGDENGTQPHNSSYAFRLKTMVLSNDGYWTADQPLTTGIERTIRYWTPDFWVEYTGPLWELNPIEVRPRERPTPATAPLPLPEQAAFAAAGVSEAELRQYMEANGLALIVVRNATTRDDFDFQQPLNLRVPDGVESINGPGKIYDVAYMQLFQGDQIRGRTGCCSSEPRAGRRVLAQELHDPAVINPPSNGPAGSVAIATDGSIAAFVPAQRALSWQLTDNDGEGVVRERYWLTFQPGEIRTCSSCHGLSEFDQEGRGEPQNEPQALIELLNFWKE